MVPAETGPDSASRKQGMVMANLVKYGAYDTEAASDEQAGMQSRADIMKLEVGKNIVRFLPPPLEATWAKNPKTGKLSPFLVVWTHYVHIPGKQEPVSFACPRSQANAPCPVCQKIDALKATGNPADYDRAKDLFAQRRVYANVINRTKPDLGVVVLPFGKKIHERLIEIRQNPDIGGDFTNPETGFDIVISRVGTGKKDTRYSADPARTTPLGNLEWITQQNDLSVFAKVFGAQEIIDKIRAAQAASPAGSGQQQAAPAQPAQPAQPKTATVVDGMTGEVVDDDKLPF